MKLTEKKIAEFFPSNNRFIYYCAKHYNYTFHHDDMVDDARYFSIINLLSYMDKHGNEFKDEPEMVSMVMSCIRYGILNAFSRKDSGRGKLDARPFADFETDSNWGSNGKDSFNRLDALMKYEPEDTGHYERLLELLIEHDLTDTQNKVLKECLLEGKTAREFCLEHGVTESVVLTAKRNIRKKFKNLIKRENEQSNSNQESVPQVERGVPENNGNQSKREYEAQEYRYLKAMSFLHS